MMNGTWAVVPARPEHVDAITRIYNEGIADRVATFETRPREASEVARWLEDPRRPVLVALRGGAVQGWIAGFAYRSRACYDGIVDFSVYVSRDARGHGVGSVLMSAFIEACASAGLWKIVARIFTGNRASRVLCARHGFREVGVYHRHGRLDGEWRDVVVVERLLPEASRD